jgi:predicted dehydrogenase
MATPVRIGVVGLGYWGPNVVRNLSDSSAFDLAYLCDSRRGALDQSEGRYPGVRCTTHFDQLLRDDEV